MAEKELLIPQIKCLYIYIFTWYDHNLWSKKVLQVELPGLEPFVGLTVHGWGWWISKIFVIFTHKLIQIGSNHPIGPWFFKLGDGKSHQLLDGSVTTSCFNDHHFEADGGSHTRGKKSRQRQCLERNDLGMIHLRWRYGFPTKGRSAGHNWGNFRRCHSLESSDSTQKKSAEQCDSMFSMLGNERHASRYGSQLVNLWLVFWNTFEHQYLTAFQTADAGDYEETHNYPVWALEAACRRTKT